LVQHYSQQSTIACPEAMNVAWGASRDVRSMSESRVMA
jgi:hypothetical protein